MFIYLVQATLVVLAGIYAMRASSVLFIRQPLHPLMIVAALALVFSTAVFHRPPNAPGAWAIVVAVLCGVGVLANALLYLRPDKAHGDTTNLAFSAAGGLVIHHHPCLRHQR
jgi:FtsH-binding integral membrane protein